MSLPFTHAGLPSLAIPWGVNAAGLPLSIQIMADWGKDEFLLKAASQILKLLQESL
jgi:Asp-tRNA(Asn)/Glu-tRNA(Gln) amidotransferase A subunit family amidase